MNIPELFKQCEEKMKGAMRALEHDFSTLRTGRANPAVLESVRIEVYGTQMPINQVASVTTPDATTIMVTPWDKSNVNAVERSILAANLGFTPVSDGANIRCMIPPLTEERRKDLVKQAHTMAEHQRVAIRNVRRHAKEEIEKHGKGKNSDMSEDEMHRHLDKLQKMTDDHIKQVDTHLAKKEAEILKV